MKRILAITLTLVMVLAALTGCMASKNPSGDEGEQNPSGKRLPITLTIAETLPSCVAFEYKDEKPYCFYAYDTEGHLYRVFWNDFTGLNEKDVVVVDHNDDIKKLEYVNPPEGWTPKYEVTATSIKMEKRANDYLVSHIQIKSGNNTIHPFGCMTWSKIDNDDGTFSESFVDKYDVIDLVSGKTPFAITDIPKLVLNDKVSYFVQVNGRVEKVYLLTPNDDNKGDYTVDLESVFKSGSTVQLSIKKIQIESGYDPNNTITVELISSVDQELNIKLHCQQSDDNLAAGDYKTLQLKKGEPTTVDLTFGGWPNSTYWVYIEADLTKAEITINP